MGELGAQAVPDPRGPHLCLWNTEAFFGLGDDPSVQYVRFDHSEGLDGRLIGSVVGGLSDERQTFVCGHSAPFVGPDFSREYEVPANVLPVLHTALEGLADRGVRQAEFRLKPPHYSESEAHIAFGLLTAGFSVKEVNVNFFLDVRDVVDAGMWAAGRKHQLRRTLEQTRSLATVETAPFDDEDTWRVGYRVLEANRVEKGRPMRLAFDYVWRIRAAFPGLVRLLVARTSDGAICAAALLYRVGFGHDVVQYWGDALHELPVSPMVLLVEGVVANSIASGACFVDLGISTDSGWPNHGLMQFKRNIGAQLETRLVLGGDVVDVLANPIWERLLA